MAGSVGVAGRADRRGWMNAGCRFDRSCRGVCGDGARVGLLAGIRPARRRCCGRRKPAAHSGTPPAVRPARAWRRPLSERLFSGAAVDQGRSKISSFAGCTRWPGGPPAGEPRPACRPL